MMKKNIILFNPTTGEVITHPADWKHLDLAYDNGYCAIAFAYGDSPVIMKLGDEKKHYKTLPEAPDPEKTLNKYLKELSYKDFDKFESNYIDNPGGYDLKNMFIEAMKRMTPTTKQIKKWIKKR